MKYSIKVTVFLLLAAVTTFFLQREPNGGALASFNQGYLDWLAANAGGKIERPAVTLVQVDSEELEKDDLDPRLDWAVILEGLDAYEPKAVGIVPSLNWETSDFLAEGALKKWIRRMPEMVLGATFSTAASDKGKDIDVSKYPLIENITGDTAPIPDAKQLVAGPDDELMINGRPAFTGIELAESTEPGPNGIPIPLLARVGDKVVASFVLQTILSYEELSAADVTVKLAPSGSRLKIGDKHNVPIDSAGNLTVYHGMHGAIPELDIYALALSLKPFETVPELQEKVDELQEVTPETIESLKHNAVVVGYDEEALQRFELPTGEKITRTELLAMAVATIQSGRHIVSWPAWVQWVSWAALALLGLFFLSGSRMRGIAGGFLALVAYAIFCIVYFQSTLAWTPPLPAVGICAAITLAGLLLPGSGKKKGQPEPEAKS